MLSYAKTQVFCFQLNNKVIQCVFSLNVAAFWSSKIRQEMLNLLYCPEQKSRHPSLSLDSGCFFAPVLVPDHFQRNSFFLKPLITALVL